MRWKQFLTPVESIDAEGARQMIEAAATDSVVLLDVRQPQEYVAGHIPGSKLIPLPDLIGRLKELDPSKPHIVYCAMGGRSRMAAQLLSGQGFREIFNLAGGFHAWTGSSAQGLEQEGLFLFTGHESPEEIFVIAYALEEGLRKFYVTMEDEVEDTETGQLFKTLAAMETGHKKRILQEYSRLFPADADVDAFEEKIVGHAMEGGFTTEEFLSMFQIDLGSPKAGIILAMGVEAQALDLYVRASRREDMSKARETLLWLAEEEKTHMQQLGARLGSLF
jgi:sulfur-carrier protein adenylyltransferase/sulfurtransferase